MIAFSHGQLMHLYMTDSEQHSIRHPVFLCLSLSFCVPLPVVFIRVCIQMEGRQAGGHPSQQGGGKEVGEGGLRRGWTRVVVADLQRRIIVGSRRVSCDSGEAKTAAVYPPSPLYPSSPLLPFPSAHQPPQHQRESVARTRLSWPELLHLGLSMV